MLKRSDAPQERVPVRRGMRAAQSPSRRVRPRLDYVILSFIGTSIQIIDRLQDINEHILRDVGVVRGARFNAPRAGGWGA